LLGPASPQEEAIGAGSRVLATTREALGWPDGPVGNATMYAPSSWNHGEGVLEALRMPGVVQIEIGHGRFFSAFRVMGTMEKRGITKGWREGSWLNGPAAAGLKAGSAEELQLRFALIRRFCSGGEIWNVLPATELNDGGRRRCAESFFFPSPSLVWGWALVGEADEGQHGGMGGGRAQ